MRECKCEYEIDESQSVSIDKSKHRKSVYVKKKNFYCCLMPAILKKINVVSNQTDGNMVNTRPIKNCNFKLKSIFHFFIFFFLFFLYFSIFLFLFF